MRGLSLRRHPDCSINGVGLFKKIFILLVFLAFSAFADEAFKVDSATVQRLETLLKENAVKTTAPDFNEMEKLFRARQAAHRIRLSQLFMTLSKDPKFLIDFPEFKPLFDTPARTVKVLLEHDAGKAFDATKPAIRALSLLQGFDYRNPNKGLPEDVDKMIRKVLKDAIDDINLADKNHMSAKLQSLSPNATWTRLHINLTETLDFYDTYKSRQAEIAGDGRKLVPPSNWIAKLEADGHYTSEQLKESELKKRFAVALETIDPLKDPANFAKAADFSKAAPAAKLSSEASWINGLFTNKGASLVSAAKRVEYVTTAREIASVTGASLRKVPVIIPAAVGIEYLVDPEKTMSANDLIAGATFTFDTYNCDTRHCSEFVRRCATKHDLPATLSFNQLARTKKFFLCINDFFEQPIELQTEQRGDHTLNEIFSQFSPGVIDLSCKTENSMLAVTVKTRPQPKQLDSQTILYNQLGEPQKMLRDSKKEDQLFMLRSVPVLLQHCKSNVDCKNYTIDEILDQKNYFWRDHDSKLGSLIGTNKNPNSSFAWAKDGQKLIERQSKKIHECCQSSACQSFYVRRNGLDPNPVSGKKTTVTTTGR